MQNSFIFTPEFPFKCRLKAYFGFWLPTLGANDFILLVIDKGYTIPFITVPQTAFFDNNHSVLMHADFVLEAIQGLLSSGFVVEVSSHPHIVNPLSVLSRVTVRRS